MKRWLVMDVHYLCHRAFHTTGKLSSGVVFGFLKSITHFKDELQSDRMVFCFEHQKLFRRDVYPSYKLRRNRKERTEEEKAQYESFSIQINELHHQLLPKIGFKNVFSQRGMESDDIMAALAEAYGEKSEVILVTADQDMYQCLSENVMIYNPQKQRLFTADWFRTEYGIAPRQWAVVKAIAGCSSDEVKGIEGVGEVTALKYVRKELPYDCRAYKAITSKAGKRCVRRNRRLVELPFDGCTIPSLQDDEISQEGWREVCGALGMKSITKHPPIRRR